MSEKIIKIDDIFYCDNEIAKIETIHHKTNLEIEDILNYIFVYKNNWNWSIFYKNNQRKTIIPLWKLNYHDNELIWIESINSKSKNKKIRWIWSLLLGYFIKNFPEKKLIISFPNESEIDFYKKTLEKLKTSKEISDYQIPNNRYHIIVFK